MVTQLADGGPSPCPGFYLSTGKQDGKLYTGQNWYASLGQASHMVGHTSDRDLQSYYMPWRKKNQKYLMNSTDSYHKEW